NLALDDVRAEESRRMLCEGRVPVLKKLDRRAPRSERNFSTVEANGTNVQTNLTQARLTYQCVLNVQHVRSTELMDAYASCLSLRHIVTPSFTRTLSCYSAGWPWQQALALCRGLRKAERH